MNRTASSLVALCVLAACGEPTRPDAADVAFTARALELDTLVSGALPLRNSGSEPALNIGIELASLKTAAGDSVLATVQPGFVASLQPGTSVQVQVSVAWTADQPPGTYEGWLSARAADPAAGADSVPVRARRLAPRSVTILQGDTSIRQGDVLELAAEITRDGAVLNESPAWSVVPAAAGFADAAGAFVAYGPDSALVIATTVDGARDTVRFGVTPRGAEGSLTLETIRNGSVSERYTSDLWVHPDGEFAYTGTWSVRSDTGNTVYVWDVRNPSAPLRTDSIRLAARTVNDVKVSADGLLGVATHEGSSPNGITLLDLTDPAHPETIRRYSAGLEIGVHNVWIERIGGRQYVFACHDDAELKIIDVTNPSNPLEVAQFTAGGSPVHDVYVRDSLAFVSHWNVGLVILDVGNGIAGGGPGNPVEVSRLVLPEGNVHNAWYEPARGLVFVGHEFAGSIGTSSGGLVSVVDVSDLRSPRRVATFQLPGAGPHNFWVDESAGVLYAAYYNAGLLAIDVNGALLGALDRQGRLVARVKPGGDVSTFVWAPQLVGAGLLFLSDMLTGLWAVSVIGLGP